MEWKNALSWKTVLAIIAVVVVAISTLALASPINYTVQQIECKTCVISANDIECWNTCDGSVCTLTPVPNPDPDPKPTPEPQPTPTPEPEPTPTPEPEPKLKCNRGTGNLSEGCDPGNSGGKPGNAGEDNE